MRYTVEWKQTATDELTLAWLDAASDAEFGVQDRARITAAAREVDRLLRADPYGQGESREWTRRVMFVAPLAASYAVDAAASKVEVLQVWTFH